MYQAAGNPQGTSHPRLGERDSRQAIQACPDHSNRVVTSFRSIPSYMLPMAPASSGPVCHQVQQQTTSVCVTGTRSPGLGSGCTTAFPGKVWTHMPFHQSHLGQSGGKVCVWGGGGGGPNIQIPLCLPNIPHLVSQPFNQVLHRNLANLNLHAWLIEPQLSRSNGSLRQWQHKLRLLKKDQLDQSMRQSGPFLQWCLSNQVDFRAPPLKVIADFLLHLFQDKKLQPGTIDGYRSAIADKLGNSTINVSKDENLTRLLDSFHRDRHKGRRFSCWLWILVSAGVGSMLGYIGTSDTSQTGLRSPCTLHPAFCPRISWRRRDQIMWPQWPYQLWPLL